MTKKVKSIGFFKTMKALGRARKNIDIQIYKTTDVNVISDDKAEFILKLKEKNFKFKNGDSLKKIQKDVSDIIGRKAIVKTTVEVEKAKVKKESDLKKGLKNFAKGWKEMNERIDKELDEKERQKKYEKMNNPEKKSGLFTFVAGAAAAGAAKNKVSPPIVVSENPDYVVVGMKPAGLNSWYVQYSKRSSMNTKSQFKVQRSRGGSTVGVGGTKFRVSWSG